MATTDKNAAAKANKAEPQAQTAPPQVGQPPQAPERTVLLLARLPLRCDGQTYAPGAQLLVDPGTARSLVLARAATEVSTQPAQT